MGSASRTVRSSAEAGCSARATAASMCVSIERRTRKCWRTHIFGHTAASCESISQLGAQSGWGFHNAWVRHAHRASEWRHANWRFRGTRKWVPKSGYQNRFHYWDPARFHVGLLKHAACSSSERRFLHLVQVSYAVCACTSFLDDLRRRES